MFAREEPGAPEALVERLRLGAPLPARGHHHEAGQVPVHGAEPVGEPRPEAGPAGLLRARLHERDRGVVVDRVGVDAAHDAQVVDHLRRVGQRLRDLGAALAVAREVELARRDREARLAGGHRRDALAVADRVGELLVEHVAELRLPVEGLELAGRAGHEQVDDPLGLGGEVRPGCAVLPPPPGERPGAEEAREGGGPDARGRAAEELATRQMSGALRGGGVAEEVEVVVVPHQFLLSASSRLRTALAARVQAACSAGSRPACSVGGMGSAPTPSSAAAAASSSR